MSIIKDNLKIDIIEFKRLKNKFMSYKFGFGSPEVKRLIELQKKLQSTGILDNNANFNRLKVTQWALKPYFKEE